MAHTKQVARVNTGGRAPPDHLARKARRKSPRVPAAKKSVRIFEIRYHPDCGDFRFEAMLEGGNRDCTQQMSLTDWKDSLLGFLIAYIGPNNDSCDG